MTKVRVDSQDCVGHQAFREIKDSQVHLAFQGFLVYEATQVFLKKDCGEIPVPLAQQE